MKKILFLFFLLLLFTNFVNSTQIWTNDGVQINSFREKIDIYKEVVNGEELSRAKIIDIFYVFIPKEMKDENIFFAFFPTNYDFSSQTENISEIMALACEAGKHEINYSLDETFGLSCPGGEFEENIAKEIKINNINLLEFNASNLDWSKFLGVNGSKPIYISISYVMDNLILETENYNTLWIKKLGCYYESPNCLDSQTAIYVSIPTYFFVEGGYNYKILKVDKRNERTIFVSENPKEDLVLSYQDIKKEKWNQIKWFLFGILLSFVLSLIANKFSEIPDYSLFTLILTFILLLIFLGSIVFYYPLKPVLIIYFIFVMFILISITWDYLFKKKGLKKIKEIYNRTINNFREQRKKY